MAWYFLTLDVVMAAVFGSVGAISDSSAARLICVPVAIVFAVLAVSVIWRLIRAAKPE